MHVFCVSCCSSTGKCTVSTNGLCGPDNSYMTCPGSEFGDCCSSKCTLLYIQPFHLLGSTRKCFLSDHND